MKALGAEDLPLLDRLAAHLPGGTRRAQRQGPRLLRPAGRRAAAPTASSPSPRSITGTCRRRCRIAAAGRTRDTAQAFADYAGYVAAQAQRPGQALLHAQRDADLRRAGPRQRRVRARPEAAAGASSTRCAIMRCSPTASRSRRSAPTAARGTKVGPAENITVACRRSRRRSNIRAAELATRELNAPYLTVMLEGRYTDAYLAAAGADAPKFTAAGSRDRSPPRSISSASTSTRRAPTCGRARPRRAIAQCRSRPPIRT